MNACCLEEEQEEEEEFHKLLSANKADHLRQLWQSCLELGWECLMSVCGNSHTNGLMFNFQQARLIYLSKFQMTVLFLAYDCAFLSCDHVVSFIWELICYQTCCFVDNAQLCLPHMLQHNPY